MDGSFSPAPKICVARLGRQQSEQRRPEHDAGKDLPDDTGLAESNGQLTEEICACHQQRQR